MHSIFFTALIASVQYPTEEIEIVYGDDRNSRLLVAELKRDWSSFDESLIKYDEISAGLHYKLIHYQDDPKYATLNVFPVYRYKSGKFKEFPHQTFASITYPLLSVNAIQQEIVVNQDIIRNHRYVDKEQYEEESIKYHIRFLTSKRVRPWNYMHRICRKCGRHWDKGIRCECDHGFRVIYHTKTLVRMEGYEPPIIRPEFATIRWPWEH